MPTDTLDPTDQEQDVEDTGTAESADAFLRQRQAQQEQQRQQQSAQQQGGNLIDKGSNAYSRFLQGKKGKEAYTIYKKAGGGKAGAKALGKWFRGGMKTAGKKAAQTAAGQTVKKAAARTIIASTWEIWGPVLAVLAAILLIIILVFAAAGWEGSKSSPTDTTQTKPITGLTMQMEGPELVRNGENITYTIVITYTGSEDIIITNPIPSNADLIATTGNRLPGDVHKWALKDNKSGTSQEYRFSITLHPKDADSIVVNKAFAESLSVSSGGSPIEGGSGNACTQPFEGKGYCSVANLKKYFNNDEKKAIIASMVCKKESGSDPLALNTNCGTNDYSVGLYQINLVAHCAGAYANQSCRQLINAEKRSVCEQTYKNPEDNIKKMLQLSNNGANWQPWGAYTHPSVGVAIKARECGIL